MIANQNQANKEYAFNVGRELKDSPWILTPTDTWEPNPHFKGERGPHPELEYFNED